MILPKYLELEGVIGAPFDYVFRLWQDKAHTSAFNPGAEPISFTIDGVGTVSTAGGGITVSTNNVTVHFDAALTALASGRTRFRMRLTDTGEYPCRGVVVWEKP